MGERPHGDLQGTAGAPHRLPCRVPFRILTGALGGRDRQDAVGQLGLRPLSQRTCAPPLFLRELSLWMLGGDAGCKQIRCSPNLLAFLRRAAGSEYEGCEERT